MQQNLFHSAHCDFLACAIVCGALLSVQAQSAADREEGSSRALGGVLLASLVNASACAARLKVVWSASSTSLFPLKSTACDPVILSTFQNIGQSSSARLFQAKKEVKRDDIAEVMSDLGVPVEGVSESAQIQYSQLLTVMNLTSCLPDSPEYLCDLAISLLESYASVAVEGGPSRDNTSSTLDAVTMQWRKIEILVLLKK